MTNYLHNNVYDDGLNAITDNTENLYILSADPELTWANIATYKLGTKATPSISAPSDRTGGGRKITATSITDGVTNTAGTGTFLALTDDSEEDVLAVLELTEELILESGVAWELPSFTIGIPAPADEDEE